ncbi:MAG TPA: FctA domain-containing protein, partial [Erysipelothrix sp.]|nr:FctA domain-containing protein [Erysipelothrix sp.]
MALFFGFGTAVYADNDLPNDMTKITVRKGLETAGNNPQETFNFEVIAKRVVEGAGTAPDIANFSITVLAGEDEGHLDINLPAFTQVGIYEYDIKEVAGNTAGMIYDDGLRTLVILVLNDGDGGFIRVAGMRIAGGQKGDDFTLANNAFNAGSLKFKKLLAGNFVDPTDEFTVTVTLTLHDGKTLKASELQALGADSILIEDDKITLTYTVVGNDEFTINNIPFDMDFAIVETNYGDYSPNIVGGSGEIEGAMNATITNTRNRDIDTGINLDNMPYLLALTFAIGGLGVVMVRRRKEH